MTRRERLTRCYCHGELDRPGVYSRTGFPADDPTYDQLKAYLKEFTELKESWPGRQFEPFPPTDTRVVHYSEDWERHVEIVHTPEGDLTCSRLHSLTGQPGLHETFLISSAEEARRFLSLPLPEIDGDPSGFFEADRKVGDRGIAEVSLGFNPAGTVAELCGSENFALMSVTDRDVLHELCERQLHILMKTLDFLLDAGVGPFFSMLGQEYIVPPLHGPEDFADFNTRYDKPIIDRIHESGGRIHIHCHGSIKTVFDQFVEMGTDVLHPFEAPPHGDLEPAEARKLAGEKICLEGNIQINRMYEAGPEEIKRETEQLIADAFTHSGGLIVSPTASPYIRGEGGTCFPQYRALVETVRQCGG
mgnify:CR=1 FL=1